jgi:hypothetical protein
MVHVLSDCIGIFCLRRGGADCAEQQCNTDKRPSAESDLLRRPTVHDYPLAYFPGLHGAGVPVCTTHRLNFGQVPVSFSR